ncbi:MAG: SMP-30/gluconolactonase/LRE family protein [Pseudomonadota bacterium]|nr:SMP-30/gluconolactonase/LRE family protein [Pseudomonadota bacterium]
MAAQFFATGIGAPEGPVCLPDGSMYVTEMSAATLQVTRLFPGGERTVVRRTGGRPNGLAVDGDGNLWIAEAGLRAVLCIDPQGRELQRIDNDGERPLRLPNDLCFGKNGLLYLTDSGMAAQDFLDGQNFAKDYRQLPWDGRVYEMDPISGKTLRVVDRGILFTNGIAFGPDDALYANASFTGEIHRYDVFGAAAPRREPFGNVLQPFEGDDFRGPDGMCWGDDGRLYCTVYGQRNVTVLNRDGSVAERLPLDGENPTNCAFALAGHNLLVTEVERGRVERVATACGGLPLHYPRLGLRRAS